MREAISTETLGSSSPIDISHDDTDITGTPVPAADPTVSPPPASATPPPRCVASGALLSSSPQQPDQPSSSLRGESGIVGGQPEPSARILGAESAGRQGDGSGSKSSGASSGGDNHVSSSATRARQEGGGASHVVFGAATSQGTQAFELPSTPMPFTYTTIATSLAPPRQIRKTGQLIHRGEAAAIGGRRADIPSCCVRQSL